MIHKLVSVMLVAVSILVVAPICTLPSSAQDMSNGVPPTLGAPPALHVPALPQSRQLAVASTDRSGGDSVGADYRFGTGDRLHINIFGQPDFTGTYNIDSTGYLTFPLIGRVHAGGLTNSELRQELVSRLSPKYLKTPSINIEVVNYRPFYILGEVRAPGSYPYVSSMTALQAIAIAGGFTYRAREDDFRVTRNAGPGDREHIIVQQDTVIEPGDVIYVRERYF